MEPASPLKAISFHAPVGYRILLTLTKPKVPAGVEASSFHRLRA
jgi:hypothetical protein